MSHIFGFLFAPIWNQPFCQPPYIWVSAFVNLIFSSLAILTLLDAFLFEQDGWVRLWLVKDPAKLLKSKVNGDLLFFHFENSSFITILYVCILYNFGKIQAPSFSHRYVRERVTLFPALPLTDKPKCNTIVFISCAFVQIRVDKYVVEHRRIEFWGISVNVKKERSKYS